MFFSKLMFLVFRIKPSCFFNKKIPQKLVLLNVSFFKHYSEKSLFHKVKDISLYYSKDARCGAILNFYLLLISLEGFLASKNKLLWEGRKMMKVKVDGFEI